MAKLSLLLASFALFLLVANASIYHTTIEIDEENPQSCQEQIEMQQHLHNCQGFIKEKIQGQRDGRSWERDNQQQQMLQQCCQQLQKLDTGCRCQGLQQIVGRQVEQGEMKGHEWDMYDTARVIPKMCRMQPRVCRFSSQMSF